MNVKVSYKWWISIGATLGLLALVWVVSTVVAQGPEPGREIEGDRGPQTELALASTVSSTISYQGVLKESGALVTGDRDMTFNFYTNDSCSGLAVYSTFENGVPVMDGLFNVKLDVTHGVFWGQGLWLEVEIGGVGIGCEEILPVPYALSLRPGATIAGDASGASFGDGVVNIDNTSPAHAGDYPALYSRTATGSALRGESGSIGVYGYSTWEPAIYGEAITSTAGYFQSGEGYGIRVNTDGDDHWDHGGYFTANQGYGLYAISTQNAAVRGESGDTSGLWQPGGHVGAVGIGEERGVYGSGGTGHGVTGISIEESGVYGETESEDYANTAGVWGQIWSGDGTAVRGLKYGDTGIGVYGSNEGSTGSGVVGESTDYIGVFGESDNYRGVHGVTGCSDHNYGLYTPDNLYSLNYHTTGAIMQVVQNSGEMPLEPGDVAVFDGIATSKAADGAPIIQVTHAARANDTGVAGVVYRRFNAKVLEEGEHATATGEGMQTDIDVTLEGPVASGEYLLLVVQGPAKVKVSALPGAIQPGDLLSTAEGKGYAARSVEVSVEGVKTFVPGTVFAKALEPLDVNEDGLIYAFVTLH